MMSAIVYLGRTSKELATVPSTRSISSRTVFDSRANAVATLHATVVEPHPHLRKRLGRWQLRNHVDSMIAQEVGHLLTIGDVRVNDYAMQLHEHIAHLYRAQDGISTIAG